MSRNSYDSIIDSALDSAEDWSGSGSIGGTVLENWLLPGAVQQREFGQEIALQQFQNEWNSEPARMKRMLDAGINPNVAAAGIAGAGNAPAVGSPNSAIGAGAAGVGAAAQAAEAANNAINAGVGAYEKLSLTGVEKDRRKAEIRNLLSSALHNDWLAYSISEMLPLQKENERADTYLKLANFDKAREEKKLIIKRVDEAQSHIDEMNAQAALYEKQGNLVDAEKLRVEAQTAQIKLQNDKLQWDKDWREMFRYDPNVPVDVALEQAMVNDSPENVVSAIGDSVKSVSYNERKGFNDAEIDDAFDKAYNQVLGENSANAEFSEYFADVEAWKEIFVDMWKEANENPHNLDGFFAKCFNSILTILSNAQVTYNYDQDPNKPIGKRKKPNVSPRRR